MNQNILNEFSIKETIGQGSFSKVKLGINKLTGEKVAIKIMDKKRIKLLSEKKRVQRELNIIKKCAYTFSKIPKLVRENKHVPGPGYYEPDKILKAIKQKKKFKT